MAQQPPDAHPPEQPPPGGPQLGGAERVDQATGQTRRFSPGFFAVIALCFLLPFVSITCSGSRLATLKGLDFVLGTEVTIDQELEESFDLDTGQTPGTDAPEGEIDVEGAEDSRVDPNIFAIAALAGAVVGIVLTMILRRRGRDLAAVVLASIVLLSLLIFRFDTSGDAEGGQGVVGIEYRFGWWIAVLVAMALVFSHLWGLRRPHR